MSDIEIKALTVEIARLELNPGDVLVLTIPRGLPLEAHDQIRQLLRHLELPGVRTCVVEQGMQFSVIETSRPAANA